MSLLLNDVVTPHTGSATYQNPLYPDVPPLVDPDEALASAEAGLNNALTAQSKLATTFVSIQKAAEQMRDYMTGRSASFVLNVNAPGYTYDDDAVYSLIVDTLMPMAYSEELSTGITTGDYLKWSWANTNFGWETYSNGNITLYFEFYYYTTASQEDWLIKNVNATVDRLNLWKVSDYKKYLGLYQFVTDHVDYDFDGLNNNDMGVFTAYAALAKGKAVCQGYATLYYAMCRAMGLPVRVITSYDHAWNIVKLGSYYWYDMDSTWDGQESSYSTLNYFLKGYSNFEASHPPEDEYLTPAFKSAYPISYYDYAPVDSDYQPVCQFRDVSPSSPYYYAIQDVADRGLFNGYNKYTFQPNGTMTRAMLVTVLWRMAGQPDVSQNTGFSDVPTGRYYSKAVAWAAQTGITNGYADGQFKPDRLLNRQQLSTFLYRYANHFGYSTAAYNDLSDYSDVDTIDDFAVDAMHWSVGAGIVNGYGNGTLRPTGNATRGQMAAMVSRFLSYYGL